jgi:hypothetical protein
MARPILFLVLMGGLAGGALLLMSGWLQPGKSEGKGLLAAQPEEDDNVDFPEESERGTDFASDRGGAPQDVTLDGPRAMRYLKAVCDIGPRMSGTRGMRQQRELLTKHFRDLGGKVTLQEFTGRQVSRENPVDMANLIVAWHPERKRRIILCSHYDTRPIADQEKDPRKWHETFVSANDGGSGVALLMELAHHMKDLPTAVGVDFVFFDGEEYIFDPRPGRDEYFLGSKHFADAWVKDRQRPQYLAAVLLDMIGGKDPHFPADFYSAQRAGKLVRALWDIARDKRCGAFQRRVGPKVLDDHIALLNRGIPAVDIIDFSYPHWHKLSDVPDNCSDEGILQVGTVLTTWLQRLK